MQKSPEVALPHVCRSIRLSEYAFYGAKRSRIRTPIVWCPQPPWTERSPVYQVESFGTLRFILPRAFEISTNLETAYDLFFEALKDYLSIDYVIVGYSDPLAGMMMGVIFEALGFTTKPINWLRYDRDIDLKSGDRARVGRHFAVEVDFDFVIDKEDEAYGSK